MSTKTPASTCILVLGMHRSGTSAVAGALARCGVEVGDRLIEAAPDNPRGYFENVDTVLANERMLDALGMSWDDVRRLPGGWLRQEAAARGAKDIREHVLPTFSAAGVWALKDPRMCRLLPLWLRELQRARARVVGLLVLRHPDEVAASLHARDGMHPFLARLLWLRYVLESARDAPPDSVVVRYSDVLANPAVTLGSALAGLSVPVDTDPRHLDDALSLDARHHRTAEAKPQDAWHALALEAYALLAAPNWRDARAPLEERLKRLEDDSAVWLETLGGVAGEASRRRKRADENALEAQRRADVLQGALDHANSVAAAHARDLKELDRAMAETARGLMHAEQVVASCSAEAARLGAELQRTQQALVAAEALVANERAEAATAIAQLRATQDALAHAEGLSSERLAELERMSGRLAAADVAVRQAEVLVEQERASASAAIEQLRVTQSALEHAEALASQHHAQLALTTRQLAAAERAVRGAEELVAERTRERDAAASAQARTETALRAAEAIADERSHEVSVLGSELESTQQELARAQDLLTKRLAENSDLLLQVRRTEQALVEAQDIVSTRDREMALLLEQLHGTEAGLANAERLAMERQARIESLEAERDAATATIERIDSDRAELRALLDRITGSRLWPAFSRVSRIERGDRIV